MVYGVGEFGSYLQTSNGFFDAARAGYEPSATTFHDGFAIEPVAENEIFGNNAALGCHLANFAYFNQDVALWDAAAKKIVKG